MHSQIWADSTTNPAQLQQTPKLHSQLVSLKTLILFHFLTRKHRILGMLKKQEDADGANKILEVSAQEPNPEGPSCSKLCWPSSLYPSVSPKHSHLPGYTWEILFIAAIDMKSEGATGFSTSPCKIPDGNKLWEFPASGTAESSSAAQIFAAGA